MTNLYKYFLASTGDVVQLECVEISHPNFSQVYRIIRNATHGISVYHETGELVHYDYVPVTLAMSGLSNDLDFSLSVNLGDLGSTLTKEYANLHATDTFKIKPKLFYRAYRSDDLSRPMVGPLILEISMMNFNREGTSFEASAPKLSINKTGEAYATDRFEGLRGFL